MIVFGSENSALNRYDRRKIETAEMHFSRRVAGFKLADHVRNTTIRYALPMYALEEIVQDYKNKRRNRITRKAFSRQTQKIKNQADEETLDDLEDDERIVSET
jgi:hypothetical protein